MTIQPKYLELREALFEEQALTKPRQVCLYEVMDDPLLFVRFLKIQTKHRKNKLRWFDLRPEQEEIFEALKGGENVLVLKARQLGISTTAQGYIFWRWLTATEPFEAATFSFKADSTKVLSRIFKTFIRNLPPALRPKLTIDNQGRIEREVDDAGNVAGYSIITAGGKGAGRSATLDIAHFSEFAFVEDGEEFRASVMGSLDTENAQFIIESTASHIGDELHREVMKVQAGRGEGPWVFFFFPWMKDPLYTVDGPPLDDITAEESALIETYGLTEGQVRWRRRKIGAIGNVEKFNREFPACISDAYAQGEGSFYAESDFSAIQVTDAPDTGLAVYAAPDDDENYCIGVDTGQGVGKNFHTATGLAKVGGYEAFVFRDNTMSPEEFGRFLFEIGMKYRAYIHLERNLWGAVVLKTLHDLNYPWIIQDDKGKDGWHTTSQNRPRIFDDGRTYIRGHNLKTLDRHTIREARALVVDDKGRIVLAVEEDEHGVSHGDNIVSFGLAVIGLAQVPMPESLNKPSFWSARWFAERNKRGGDPFWPAGR